MRQPMRSNIKRGPRPVPKRDDFYVPRQKKEPTIEESFDYRGMSFEQAKANNVPKSRLMATVKTLRHTRDAFTAEGSRDYVRLSNTIADLDRTIAQY